MSDICLHTTAGAALECRERYARSHYGPDAMTVIPIRRRSDGSYFLDARGMRIDTDGTPIGTTQRLERIAR